MAQAGKSDRRGERSPKDSATEVWGLVRDYAKQETIDPVKGLLSFVKVALPGAILLAIGLIMLSVAVLRMVQTEIVTWVDGRLSFIPYLVALVAMSLALLLAKRAMTSQKQV